MTCIGKVSKGVVILPPGVDLPEGAEVEVRTSRPASVGEDITNGLLRIAKQAQGLPSDLAKNHDYYLHGRPKK